MVKGLVILLLACGLVYLILEIVNEPDDHEGW